MDHYKSHSELQSVVYSENQFNLKRIGCCFTDCPFHFQWQIWL